MIQPRWAWQFTDGMGDALADAPSPVFTQRYDAEEWLGASWRDVAERGAGAAQLLNDGAPVGSLVDLRRVD